MTTFPPTRAKTFSYPRQIIFRVPRFAPSDPNCPSGSPDSRLAGVAISRRNCCRRLEYAVAGRPVVTGKTPPPDVGKSSNFDLRKPLKKNTETADKTLRNYSLFPASVPRPSLAHSQVRQLTSELTCCRRKGKDELALVTTLHQLALELVFRY